MQGLHDQLPNFQVAADEKSDSTRAIQELGRLCTEVGELGDVAVDAHKTHAFLRAPPDEKYKSLETVLLCDRQRDSNTSKFQDIAALATSYRSMQIRENLPPSKPSAGRDDK